MESSDTDKEAQLAGRGKLAEVGEEGILLRRGRDVVPPVTVSAGEDAVGRRALVERVRAEASAKAGPGAEAARSHDFLYGEDGLPG